MLIKYKFREIMKNKKGFVFSVGFVLAVGLALLILVFAGAGGLSATWKAGSTLANAVNIVGSVPAIAWVFVGFLFLISLLRGRR